MGETPRVVRYLPVTAGLADSQTHRDAKNGQLPVAQDALPMTTHHADELVVPVIEEWLEIGREQVDTGRTLRLRKQVEEVPAHVREPVNTTMVDVQRVPVGRVVDEPPAVRHEGDVMVVPVIQERLVTRKELVLVEEIRLTRRQLVTQAESDVVLRRERVVVERFDPDTGQWQPEPGAESPSP